MADRRQPALRLVTALRRATERHADGLRDVGLPFLVSRATLVLVSIVALSILPLSSDARASDHTAHPWINAFARWDANFYASVAASGYEYDEAARWSNAAFFPLYPLLMRLTALPFGGDRGALMLAGVVVSNLALVVGLVYVWALARRELGRDVAAASVVALVAFPMSFALSTVRSEGLFLALAAGSLYHARAGQWWRSGALGAALALTRPMGVVIVVPLLVEWLADPERRARFLTPRSLALALPIVAFAGFSAYLAATYGDPFLWMQAQEKWARGFDLSLEALRRIVPVHLHGFRNSMLDFAFALAYVGLAVLAARWLRPSLAVFAAIMVAIPLVSGSFNSFPRYGTVVFPLFMVLGLAFVRRPWMEQAYLIAAAPLAGLFMAMFALWYWVA